MSEFNDPCPTCGVRFRDHNVGVEHPDHLWGRARAERDPDSPQWEDCKVCGGDHWTKDHRAVSGEGPEPPREDVP